MNFSSINSNNLGDCVVVKYWKQMNGFMFDYHPQKIQLDIFSMYNLFKYLVLILLKYQV